jgi:hypothetical protein
VLSTRTVIWSGTDDVSALATRLAVEHIVEAGDEAIPGSYQKWLYLTDAETGEILFEENQILHAITGTVKGRAIDGIGADICHGVVLEPMPYARVTMGTTTVFADSAGNYTIPGAAGTVTVESRVRGLRFRIVNQSGSDAVLNQVVNAPGEAHFIHNNANSGEYPRAEVNAYVAANRVRDFALTYNPAYPVIANQQEFTVNVNVAATCNANYTGSSINLFRAGGGCTNTAASTVVYHEYGHHLVGSGGSGQGAYGEGMSDCISVVLTDDPWLGPGFNSNCGQPLRNADNDCQYLTSGCSTCGSAIHSCGRLLSGCVWSTRNELAATHPSTYRDIIAGLTVNSILLHTGTTITPSITIDFLTLDDDDDDIFNGTPHYQQINAGFSAHSMPGPQIDLLTFVFPAGLPDSAHPTTGADVRVEVQALSGTPQPGTGMLHYRLGSAGAFTGVPMQEVAPNVYETVLPAVGECGDFIEYYFSAAATNGSVVTNPRMAPADAYELVVATATPVLFADDFDTDLGWTAGAPGDTATTGHWVRDWPVGTSSGGQQAQPNAPYVGSACYITGQHPGGGAGANDVDNGKTTLLSPIFTFDEGTDAVISYVRWYSNHAGANPFNDIFVVDVSGDGGLNWVNAETVGPSGPQVQGGWYQSRFKVSDFFAPGSGPIRVRFVASDYDPQALVEAAVDQFRVMLIECDESTACPGDVSGDGQVDVFDLLQLLGAWGPCDGCPEDVTGDGQVDVFDLLDLLGAWGECP